MTESVAIPGIRPGALLGDYRIEALIGRGGMGMVYVAEQVSLGRRVALKVIAPELAGSPQFQSRFDHESRMAAAIDHPNVVPLFEAGRIGDIAYLAMRYIEGTDLRSLIDRNGGLVPEAAIPVVAQVAAALDAAHALGLVHRDVKPANVLIADPAGAMHCYLSDFGLTKHTTSGGGLTATGQWVGTLDYVAPEQVSGDAVDARADIYALGCVLYQTLSGRAPFPRESDIAKLYAHAHEPPPAVTAAAPHLPPDLDGVIARALAKDPGDRYPSAGDLARAAQAAAIGLRVDVPERSVAAGCAAPSATSARRPATNAGTRLELPPSPASGPPPGSTPVTYALPAGGRGAGVAVAIVVAALLLAAGGVAAALIISGGGGAPAPPASSAGTDPPPSTRQTGPAVEPPGNDARTTATEPDEPRRAAGTNLEPYAASTYDVQAPAAWTVEQDDERQPDGRRVSKWRGRDGMSVLVDTTPDFEGDVMESAVKLERAQAARDGYRRLSFEPFTSAGDDAFEWSFRDGQTGSYKVDLFVFRGGDGFAVLGEAADEEDLDRVRDIALEMLDSIEPR
jgi:hypothetical protein